MTIRDKAILLRTHALEGKMSPQLNQYTIDMLVTEFEEELETPIELVETATLVDLCDFIETSIPTKGKDYA